MPGSGTGMGYSPDPIELTEEELCLARRIIFGFSTFTRRELSETLSLRVKGPQSGLMPMSYRYGRPCEKLIVTLIKNGVVTQVSGTEIQIYNGTGYVIKGDRPVFEMTTKGRVAFLKRENNERFASINRT